MVTLCLFIVRGHLLAILEKLNKESMDHAIGLILMFTIAFLLYFND
jgi:hypothetical protein